MFLSFVTQPGTLKGLPELPTTMSPQTSFPSPTTIEFMIGVNYPQ